MRATRCCRGPLRWRYLPTSSSTISTPTFCPPPLPHACTPIIHSQSWIVHAPPTPPLPQLAMVVPPPPELPSSNIAGAMDYDNNAAYIHPCPTVVHHYNDRWCSCHSPSPSSGLRPPYQSLYIRRHTKSKIPVRQPKTRTHQS